MNASFNQTDNKPLHIGIDGNEANIENRVGSNQFAHALLKALHQLDIPDTFTVYLKSPPVSDMPAPTERWRYRVLKPQKLWTQWRLPLDLYFHPRRPQVFFSPGHYAPRFSPIPTVVTVMDLAFLKFPNLFLKFKKGVAQLQAWTEYSVKNAAQVIAISKNTKQDIQEHYGVEAQKITVAYPGIDTDFFKPQPKTRVTGVRKKYNLNPNYILYVGTLQPRKNLVRLLHAFEQLPPKYKTYQLVLAGEKGWLYDNLVKSINQSKKKDRIRLTGYVDRQDLPALYTGSACTCLVGLYEGFGIPPVEALSSGAIPVVSNSSSLPEAVGKAGITVNPYSVQSIKNGIIKAVSMTPETKKERLKLAKTQVQKFDYRKSAQKVLKTLYDVALHR